eukprot:TRINITY_DN11089_c0_g1_i1.p1 TRINITY_DN11089_c0_g1~~TRINITY_DN11089_c0_g1_i1.p1  ORF type:complete len:535 (+),score=91.30 TRINITY_DN11089_c0_g1_i1:244-1848(+)
MDFPESSPSRGVPLSTSVVLFFCCLFNPAVLSIPHLLHHTGIILTFLFAILGAFVALSTCVALCELLGRLRGNQVFRFHVELSQVLIAYLGLDYRPIVLVTVHGFFLVMQIMYATILASLVDALLRAMLGATYAIDVAERKGSWGIHEVIETHFVSNPFQMHAEIPLSPQEHHDFHATPVLVSAGFTLALLIFLPLSLVVFTSIQRLSCCAKASGWAVAGLVILLILVSIRQQSRGHELFEHVVWFPSAAAPLLDSPVIFLLFSVAGFIPSWVAVRTRDVAGYVRVVLTVAFVLGLLGVAAVGTLTGGLSSPSLLNSQTSILLVGPEAPRWAVGLSTVPMLMTFGVGYLWVCIAQTSNVLHSRTLGTTFSQRPNATRALVCVFPWLLAWLGESVPWFYVGIGWAAIVFNGLACYLLPLLAYVKMARAVEQRMDPVLVPPVAAFGDASADEPVDSLELVPLADGAPGLMSYPSSPSYGTTGSRLVMSAAPELTLVSERTSNFVLPSLIGVAMLVAVIVWMFVCLVANILLLPKSQ